jgi:hypothetical protein
LSKINSFNLLQYIFNDSKGQNPMGEMSQQGPEPMIGMAPKARGFVHQTDQQMECKNMRQMEQQMAQQMAQQMGR